VNDGYDAVWAPFPTGEIDVRGGAPSEGTMPPAYYAFTVSTHSAVPIEVAAGAILQVWFPFVLDERDRYVLQLDPHSRGTETIVGTMRDNTMTFTLPALTILGHDAVRGEIVARPRS
jgi:hypothetical protein